jgi:hypothetical protein
MYSEKNLFLWYWGLSSEFPTVVKNFKIWLLSGITNETHCVAGFDYLGQRLRKEKCGLRYLREAGLKWLGKFRSNFLRNTLKKTYNIDGIVITELRTVIPWSKNWCFQYCWEECALKLTQPRLLDRFTLYLEGPIELQKTWWTMPQSVIIRSWIVSS